MKAAPETFSSCDVMKKLPFLVPDYPAHEDLVAPARRYPQVWRLILGLIIVVIISLGGSWLFFALMARLSADLQTPGAGATPGQMLVLLF